MCADWAPKSTSDCSTPAPHADISGNGTAFTEDFSYIQINFLKFRDPNCCGQLNLQAAGGDQGVSSISVADLKAKGMADLAVADLNGDGDALDLVAHIYDVETRLVVNLGLASGDLLGVNAPASVGFVPVSEDSDGLDRNGDGTVDSVAAGVRYAADRGARIINLSVGTPQDNAVMRSAVQYALNAPQKPIITKVRTSGETRKRPSGPVSVPKKPMTKEPATFTSMVPHGNVPPTVWATKPEHQNRATLPSAPPIATQR